MRGAAAVVAILLATTLAGCGGGDSSSSADPSTSDSFTGPASSGATDSTAVRQFARALKALDRNPVQSYAVQVKVGQDVSKDIAYVVARGVLYGTGQVEVSQGIASRVDLLARDHQGLIRLGAWGRPQNRCWLEVASTSIAGGGRVQLLKQLDVSPGPRPGSLTATVPVQEVASLIGITTDATDVPVPASVSVLDDGRVRLDVEGSAVQAALQSATATPSGDGAAQLPDTTVEVTFDRHGDASRIPDPGPDRLMTQDAFTAGRACAAEKR